MNTVGTVLAAAGFGMGIAALAVWLHSLLNWEGHGCPYDDCGYCTYAYGCREKEERDGGSTCKS